MIALVLLGGFIAYGFMRISELTKNVSSLSVELADTNAKIAPKHKPTFRRVGVHNCHIVPEHKTNFRKKLRTLRAQTVGLSNTLSNTQQNIDAVKTQVGGVEKTVGSISGTVGVLQKLSQIDQELLMKYSKVYFMNENYTPSHLINVPTDYLYSALRSETIPHGGLAVS